MTQAVHICVVLVSVLTLWSAALTPSAFTQASKLKNGVHFCTARIRFVCSFIYLNVSKHMLHFHFLAPFTWLTLAVPWQIFADFQQIRREIEAETERTSGDNKVKDGSPNLMRLVAQTTLLRLLKCFTFSLPFRESVLSPYTWRFSPPKSWISHWWIYLGSQR